MIITPELEAAREISRVVKFPPALKVDTLAKGKVEIIGFKLKEGSPVAGKRLMDLPAKYGAKVLICAVERAGKIIVPDGGFALDTGDKLHIMGGGGNITSFINQIERDMLRIRNIMIVGGGRICQYLVSMLDDRGLQIKIVEKDSARCQELSELLPRATIIEGDGTDWELLDSEGIDSMDAFISLTGIDEENMVVATLAYKRKVPKIIAKISRSHYAALAEEMGVGTVINPKTTAVARITQYVRAMNSTNSAHIRSLHKLFDGSVEALEFFVGEETRNRGVPLSKLRLKKDLLAAVIVRGTQVIIPHGDDSIMLGDSVMIISNKHPLSELNDIFLD
jgi:trk system potassium uptake protein TrkA